MAVITTVKYDVMEDTYARVQGLKIRIRRRRADGPALILINGLGACLEAWEPLTRRLPGRDIIAIDHPGCGLSSPPNRVLSMPEIAQFYIEVLDLLGIKRADMMGFSFGGTVVQQIAHDHPDRINSMILCATAPGGGGVPPDPMTLMAAANPWRYVVPMVRELAAPVIYRGRCGRDPHLFETELVGWDTHRTTLLGVGAQVAAFVGWSSIPWLSTLNTPALVLGGAEDPMAPVGNSHLMARLLPDAELHVIEGGGHLFPFDLPGKAAPLITDFLDRNNPQIAA